MMRLQGACCGSEGIGGAGLQRVWFRLCGEICVLLSDHRVAISVLWGAMLLRHLVDRNGAWL
jgi:hypothetical protein